MALDLDKYRTRLQQEKNRLEADRSQLMQGSESGEISELTDFDYNHPGDLGTATFEREKDAALEGNLTDMLGQIDAALARIDAGTYGKCENCGKEISAARLDAVPWTTLCLEDQERVEETE